MSKQLLILFLFLLSSKAAFADPAAQGSVRSDTGNGLIDPEFTEGQIETSSVRLSVQGGFVAASDDVVGVEGEAVLDLGTYYLGGAGGASSSESGAIAFFVFDSETKLHGRYTGEQHKYGYQSPSAGLLGLGFKDKVHLSTLTPKQREEEPENDGAVAGSEHYSNRFHKDSFKINLVSIRHQVEKNKYLDIEMDGFFLEFLRLSGHAAFRVDGYNVDLCFTGNGIATLTKEIIAGQEVEAGAKGLETNACAGVQIGDIGNLRDEFNLRYLEGEFNGMVSGQRAFARTLRIENTVRFSNIADSGFGVFWTHFNEDVSHPVSGDEEISGNVFGVSYR